MTLRAVTSADLSWELSAIIYPAEIHRAKLMQFCPRKKDVASPTYFPLKHRSHRRREELCGCTVCFFSGDFKALTLILKLNNWAWICDHSCWQNGQVLFYCVCVCVCAHSLSTIGFLFVLYSLIIYQLHHRRSRLTLYSVHIPIKLTACWGQLLLPRSTRLRVLSHLAC